MQCVYEILNDIIHFGVRLGWVRFGHRNTHHTIDVYVCTYNVWLRFGGTSQCVWLGYLSLIDTICLYTLTNVRWINKINICVDIESLVNSSTIGWPPFNRTKAEKSDCLHLASESSRSLATHHQLTKDQAKNCRSPDATAQWMVASPGSGHHSRHRLRDVAALVVGTIVEWANAASRLQVVVIRDRWRCRCFCCCCQPIVFTIPRYNFE